VSAREPCSRGTPGCLSSHKFTDKCDGKTADTMAALEARGLLLSDTAPCIGCGKLLAEHVGGRCPPKGYTAVPTAADVERARYAVDLANAEALGTAAALLQVLEETGKVPSERLRGDLAAALADYRSASDRYRDLAEARLKAARRP
jgi:hypothetical protein